MTRILLDMDGVVCDFLTPLLAQYNHLTGEQVKVSDIKGHKTVKYVKQRGVILKVVDTPGFIRNLLPIDGALEGIRTLHAAGHDIVFVSNATNCPTSGHEKRLWLKYYLGDLWEKPQLVLTYHKYLVKGDLLLDDNPENLERLETGTRPLLFDQPYNATETRFERVYGWSKFVGLVNGLSA